MGHWLDLDHNFFLYVNGLSGSPLDYLFAWPTYLGLGSVILGLAFVLMLIWDSKAMMRKFIALAISIASLGGGVQLLKEAVKRPRPYAFFYPEIAHGKASVNCIFEVSVANSFPSGHAAAIFAAVVLLNHFYKGRLLFLYPIALLVAFSRIYTGVHFPSDVLGGILLGILWGILSIKILEKVEKRINLAQ